MAGNTDQNGKQNDNGQIVTETPAFSEQENTKKNVAPEKCAATEIKEKMFYGVEDVPPPHLCFLFGLQVFNQYISIRGRWGRGGYGVKRHFQQYFSYIVSFIGGGNWSIPRHERSSKLW